MSSGRNVDLIVLDFYLPEETTGIAFFCELKSKGYDLPVILVTGRSAESLVIEALRAGVRDFVVKTPEYLSYLPHAVERVLKQVQLEQQLRHSEEQYRSLVDYAYDAIFTFSPAGQITSLNPAFERMTGWHCSEWIGESFPKLIHPDDVDWARKLLDRVLRGENPPSFELRVATHNGGYVPAEFTMTSQSLGDRTIGVIGIGRDIRQRRSLEEQIRQMQKLDSIGQFAAGIAHDFNNIVTVQQGFASLLLQEPELPSHLADLVQQIIEAGGRATKLTRQLLLFSRKQAMQPQKLQLNSVVQELSQMLRRVLGEHISLRLECAEQLPPLLADPGMVEQVLMNLAINARDAMANGGSLVISTSSVQLDELAARPNPRHVRERSSASPWPTRERESNPKSWCICLSLCSRRRKLIEERDWDWPPSTGS
jgi:PAS domain S-box-containing protein